MKFHDSDPAVIYRYGLRRPDKPTSARLLDEMRWANRFYNALIEIMRRKGDAVQAARRKLYPEYEALETQAAELVQQLDAKRASIKSVNAKSRTRGENAGLKLQAAKLKDELAQVRAQLKEQRAALKDDVALLAAWDQCEAAANAEVKAARKARECSWGTGGDIEASVQQATQKSHGMPRFRRWDGGGKFTVQIQGGMSIEDAFGGADTRLRIDDLPNRDTIDKVPRSKRMTTLHLRIGSDAERRPVWVSVPLIYHRPLPPDAQIKRAYVTCKIVGKRPVWEAGFVLARESGWSKPDLADSGTVGIDVGWRLIDKGLRVAYFAGDDGQFGQVVLPYEWIETWKRIENRQSARDSAFNAARDRLAHWVDERLRAAEKDATLSPPEWLIERLKDRDGTRMTLRQWRSANRLWSVVAHWRDNRFAGDSEIYDWMLSWWREERREHDGIEGQRRHQIQHRDEQYRQVAVWLRRRYRTACVESCNWAKMQRNAEAEEEADDGALKHHMRRAAVGKLLELIREHVAQVVGVPAKDTTRKCHACGHVGGIDTEFIEVECPECGVLIDQDKRAALNLLAARAEVPEAVS